MATCGATTPGSGADGRYGALASMGGVFSTVATWPAGSLASRTRCRRATSPRGPPALPRDPPRDAAGHRPSRHRSAATAADVATDRESGGYGFGLFIIDDMPDGRIVGHAGGYPGSGRTCAGIRRQASASSCSGTAATRRIRRM